MTTDEFVDALTACAGAYTWVVDECMGWLRAYPSTPAADQLAYCPLTALAHALDGESWDTAEWDNAAQSYGLPLDAASAIVGAADEDGSAVDGALRARLLAAVGL